ncbi:general substrate transporter [Pseudomassariella vexata]|uniref:General substrate transporter n=1 Tax=Pseudomassariella vexata TaxID=1141098 RepID=A0A1Y2E1F0_9PEZI|nr:general substrate transporter [Pseudomassariella vexata]ORY65329.1 general substrate transporter [Pseudomassariella vexata]
MALKSAGRLQLIFLAIVNSVSMAHFGYDQVPHHSPASLPVANSKHPQGIFSGALISADFIKLFPETSDPNISGITSSCFSLGAFFGCIAAFLLGDRLGRRRTVWAGLFTNVIGAVLQIAAYHLPQMIVGRLINGFGMGLTSSTCPVFMAETSPSHIRGKLVVLGSLCNTTGFCLASWINYALFNDNGPLQWRFPLAFQLVFPLIVTLFLPFTIESPRWLLLRGRNYDAQRALCQLRGKGQNLEDKDLNDDMKSIQQAIQDERADLSTLRETLLFRDPNRNFRRLLLSCGTMVMQQFSGVNALSYYLPTLLIQSVGVSSENARLLTGANATVYLGAAFLCLLLVDLVGRRKLMMYGSVAMGSCYLIAAVTLKEASLHPEQKTTLGSVTVAMFFLYYFFYGTSFAKVAWVYNAEVNSLGWRTRGAAAATATNWLGGFTTVQFTKVGVNNLGWGFYLLFSCFCYSYLPVVYLLYPETSRRTLEDMTEIFKGNSRLLVFNNHILTQRKRPQVFIDAERRRIDGRTSGTGNV